MINVRITKLQNKEDLKLTTKPYVIRGRVLVGYACEQWVSRIERFPTESVSERPIPEYDYDKYSQNYEIIGAYVDGKCVGFALLERESRTRYLYVKEVRTDAKYVNQGISSKLLQYCYDTALGLNYRGIYAVIPDSNVDACEFYLFNQFRIGGLDSEYYMGTAREGEKDIIFYRG